MRCIQTGIVRPKRGHRGVQRYIRDRWSDDVLPVNCFLVERPGGLVLFDTGQSALAAEPGYLPRWHPFLRLARFELRPADEVSRQIVDLGYSPADVHTVVLSHLHTDHIGGLPPFRASEVVVTRLEWERATGIRGAIRGYLPQHWPQGLEPRLVEWEPVPIGPFAESYSLSSDGDLTMVPIPGSHPRARWIARPDRRGQHAPDRRCRTHGRGVSRVGAGGRGVGAPRARHRSRVSRRRRRRARRRRTGADGRGQPAACGRGGALMLDAPCGATETGERILLHARLLRTRPESPALL